MGTFVVVYLECFRAPAAALSPRPADATYLGYLRQGTWVGKNVETPKQPDPMAANANYPA